MIAVVRYALILAAILAAPFYAAWVLGGWIADKQAQKKLEPLKGEH